MRSLALLYVALSAVPLVRLRPAHADVGTCAVLAQRSPSSVLQLYYVKSDNLLCLVKGDQVLCRARPRTGAAREAG